jgi:hypothetical protein
MPLERPAKAVTGEERFQSALRQNDAVGVVDGILARLSQTDSIYLPSLIADCIGEIRKRYAQNPHAGPAEEDAALTTKQLERKTQKEHQRATLEASDLLAIAYLLESERASTALKIEGELELRKGELLAKRKTWATSVLPKDA